MSKSEERVLHTSIIKVYRSMYGEVDAFGEVVSALPGLKWNHNVTFNVGDAKCFSMEIAPQFSNASPDLSDCTFIFGIIPKSCGIDVEDIETKAGLFFELSSGQLIKQYSVIIEEWEDIFKGDDSAAVSRVCLVF